MAESKGEPFSEKVLVAGKEEKLDKKKQTYFSIKSDKNLVFNVSKAKMDSHGEIKLGETYVMDGMTLPPLPGYTHGSRWVNTYKSYVVADQPTAAMPTPTDSPKPAPHPAPRNEYEAGQAKRVEDVERGQAWNLAVQAVLSSGRSPLAQEPNEEADFWKQVFIQADKFYNSKQEYNQTAGKHDPDF